MKLVFYQSTNEILFGKRKFRIQMVVSPALTSAPKTAKQ